MYTYGTRYQGMLDCPRIGCGWDAYSIIKAGTSTLELHYYLDRENPTGKWGK